MRLMDDIKPAIANEIKNNQPKTTVRSSIETITWIITILSGIILIYEFIIKKWFNK